MQYFAKIKTNETALDVYKKFGDLTSWSNIVLDSPNTNKTVSEYTKLKEKLQKTHDSITIDSLYSLGKTAREIAKELKWFQSNNIEIYVIDLTSTMKTKITRVSILYDVNQMYANREIQHIKEGQKNIKNTKHIGRPTISYPNNWENLYNQWNLGEITSAEFEEMSELSHGTFYNLLKKYKNELSTQTTIKNA